MTSDMLFTERMKRATRKVHSVSDSLVRVKLAMALNFDTAWEEGVHKFYIIFKFLEEAMLKKRNENLGKMFIPGLARTEAFEEDLTHYFGPNWRESYAISDCVLTYYNHLEELFVKDPDLLMAYVYHLYMGLLFGGQLLRKKRSLGRNIFPLEVQRKGEAVTDFGNYKISDLKMELKNTMNSIAETLSEETRKKIIEESINVFMFNNDVIRSIKTSWYVFGKKTVAVIFLFCLISLIVVYIYLLP